MSTAFAELKSIASLDTALFESSVDTVKQKSAEASEAAQVTGSVKVDADTTAADRGIEAVMARAEGESALVDVDANTDPADVAVNSLVNKTSKQQVNIKVGADTSPAQSAFSAAFRRATGLSLNAAGIGLAFVGAAAGVSQFVKAQASLAAETVRTANALGITAGFLDAIKDSAESTGASAQGFQQKVAKLVESQEEAIGGNKGMAESFAKLGISMGQLQNLSPEQLLLAVAQGAQTSATSVSSLNDVMGRNAAAEYSATLKTLAEKGMPQATEAANLQIVALAELNRKWVTLKDSVQDYARAQLVAFGRTVGLIESESQARAKAEAERFKQDQAQLVRLKEMRAEREKDRKEKIFKEVEQAADKKADLEKRLQESIQNITVQAPQAADNLARIGGIIGGQTDKGRGLAERQLKEAELQTKLTEDMVKVVADMEKGIAEINSQLKE